MHTDANGIKNQLYLGKGEPYICGSLLVRDIRKEKIYMLAWPKYFQNPLFLEATRKFLLPEELRPVIMQYCGIDNKSSVLDVGCGTGFLARFFAESGRDVKVTGIECEEDFVRYGRSTAEENGLDISFVCGDALAMPFEDAAFDAVASHTFLTSVCNPKAALKEMIRVCKEGGTVSSITSMSVLPQAFHSGFYNEECTWAKPLAGLNKKMWEMFEKMNSMNNYLKGIQTSQIPHLFAESGLKEIGAYPIGKLFSLSNSLLPYEERLDYLQKMMESERQKLNAYMEFEEARKYFTEKDMDRYLGLMQEKYEYYRKHPEENQIWEWNGGANVLIFGKKL